MQKQSDVPRLLTPPGRSESGKTPEIAPILVSKRTAAAALSVCLRTIDNLIAAKELPTRRIGSRRLIPHAAVVAFAKRDHTGKPGRSKRKAETLREFGGAEAHTSEAHATAPQPGELIARASAE